MMKPKKISSFMGRILEADPRLDQIFYNHTKGELSVRFRSPTARAELLDEIELPVRSLDCFQAWTGTEDKYEILYFVMWNCLEIGKDKPTKGVGFSFGKNDAKQSRKLVKEQEDEGARVIGGRRHVGSGALSDLKSDASSADWQQEAKQTKHKSFGLTLEILSKITREARVQDKKPMVFLRFTDIPDDMSVESDWVIIPKSAFEGMEK